MAGGDDILHPRCMASFFSCVSWIIGCTIVTIADYLAVTIGHAEIAVSVEHCPESESVAVQPPRFEFYDPQTPIYTSPRFLPPAKVVKSKINDAIISHGSYLEECTVSNAIVGLRSRIDKGAVIQVSHAAHNPWKTCLDIS